MSLPYKQVLAHAPPLVYVQVVELEASRSLQLAVVAFDKKNEANLRGVRRSVGQ